MSWLSSLFGGGGGSSSNSQSQMIWPKVVELPQYSFTEPRLKLTSDFISQNIERMSQGKYPAYYEAAQPMLRENLSRPNYETYYGKAGKPGVLRSTMDVGSITGVGPKKTQASVERALYDYANAEKAIDEYLTKMGVEIMQKDAYTFPMLSAQMPKGPDTTVVSPMIVGGAQNNTGSALGSLASTFDLSKLLGLGGDLLNGNKQNIDYGALKQTATGIENMVSGGGQNYNNYPIATSAGTVPWSSTFQATPKSSDLTSNPAFYGIYSSFANEPISVRR